MEQIIKQNTFSRSAMSQAKNGWNWYCIGIPHEICTEESVQYGVQHGK